MRYISKLAQKSVQNRGKVAEWKPYERESGKVRRIPCTPLAQAALSVLLKSRLEAGANGGCSADCR